MKLYLWYSPKLDMIDLVPVGECREFEDCSWDTCAYLRFLKNDETGFFYYIGEL